MDISVLDGFCGYHPHIGRVIWVVLHRPYYVDERVYSYMLGYGGWALLRTYLTIHGEIIRTFSSLSVESIIVYNTRSKCSEIKKLIDVLCLFCAHHLG